MAQTKKASKSKSTSKGLFAGPAEIRDENAYRMSLIKALNAANVELESGTKKDMALQYMKVNGFTVRGLGILPESAFRTIGTLAYINTNVMKLSDTDVTRLHTMINELAQTAKPEVAEVAEVAKPAVPMMSIRDKMSLKADKLMLELDQAIDDLFAGKATDFDVSKWIIINAIPGMLAKVIVEKMGTVIHDMEMVHAKDADYVEAYSHIPAVRLKMIRNTINHIVRALSSHKTVKVAKPVSKRQKAKQATARFSRAVLRTKAFEWMKEGKTNKEIATIFATEFHVKANTANSYVHGFRKEFTPPAAATKS